MTWFSPYLVADGQVDARSLDTIVADGRFAGKQGEDLAVALWRWLVDPKEGFYHFLAPTEEPGQTLVADPVKDPLRLLNSYGYGLCGNVAMIFAGLYDWAGGKSRIVGVPGHTISEAYWNDTWHLIDCDLRALHYKAGDRGQGTGDGRRGDAETRGHGDAETRRATAAGYDVASLHDLVTHPEMVGNPVCKSDPYYMSDEHARDIQRQCYEPRQERYLPHYLYRLGSMDYALRPGESLTCHYQPQSHFYWGEDWGQWIKGDDLGRFTGPKDKKDEARRYANACIRWQPNLQTDLGDFGVSCGGFEAAPAGLVARSATAAVRYRLVSPYVICGRYEASDVTRKRIDGLLLRMNASARPAVTVHTPRNGRTVQVPMEQDGCEYTADLTEWADLHYEYELTVSLAVGEVLRGILVETWCQASPMTLPFWYLPGRPVRLATGSAWKDLQGRTVLPHLVDLVQMLQKAADQPAEERFAPLEKGPSGTPNGMGTESDRPATCSGFSPCLRASVVHTHVTPLGMPGDSTTRKILPQDGQVLATVPVEPPMAGRIVRLHAMAGIASTADPTGGGEAAIEVAMHPAGPWQVLDCRPVPVDPEEFHFSVEGVWTLPQPAGKVWLRLRSSQPVGVWRVRVDYEPELPSEGQKAVPFSPPLDLLLRWRQDGKLRMYQRRFSRPDPAESFVPVPDAGAIQPLHLVLSVPSR